MIEDWLRAHDLTIKGDWQKFRTADRMPTALGYRFGRGYTYLRKRNLFRMTRQLHSLRRKLARGRESPYRSHSAYCPAWDSSSIAAAYTSTEGSCAREHRK